VFSNAELIAKRLQLAKEVVPRAARVALIPAPRPLGAGTENWLRDSQVAARKVGFTTQVLVVHDLKQWDQVFGEAARGRADLVYFVEWAPHIAYRRQIAEQALRFRLPTLFAPRIHVEAGSLLSYASSAIELNRRAADYVDISKYVGLVKSSRVPA
jgi:hypothetical protein